MKFFGCLLSLPLVVATIADARVPSTFARRVVFTPPSNYTIPRTLYARTAQLLNGDLLATWENYSPEPPMVYFPIYKSTNGGYDWKELSRVQDQANGWGLRYQPFLYVLPEQLAGYKAGTVLLAGSSIPTDLSKTQIDLYASEDSGMTWKFVSHIAAGGVAKPTNGLTPVWEPFLMKYKDSLICYYSDQRDNATHGQKMVHQTTTNLTSWGPIIDDVAYPTYTDRPGMPVIVQLPNSSFLMTYEYGGGPGFSSYSFPVYYKIAADPEKFGNVTGVPLVVSDGTKPTGSPYVVWSRTGGVNGTLIVSSSSNTEVFVNTALGAGTWRKISTPEASHYTRHLRVLKESGKLLIMGGGHLPPATTNKVQLSTMNLTALV